MISFLAEIVQEGEDCIKATREANDAVMPHPELLAYAQSLSAFTSAPQNMPDLSPPELSPQPLFFPPFPNEEKVRRGHLNDEALLGVLGETHSKGKYKIPPTVSPRPIEVPPHMAGPGVNPYRADRPPQSHFFDLDLDLSPNL
ncbi:hypothetical protein OBBRIDRAFT_733869 [Obba rivulosa]|uniref:Mediator of RNA polymerase II transcription subunit 4 n=1 Tax=Obba rivulosa TaxID=1052685 RepID=A0A8E2AQE2_9APHY|nr:hypothetical protein OBBRIDRAFT_733869 [Obba rivulosa]